MLLLQTVPIVDPSADASGFLDQLMAAITARRWDVAAILLAIMLVAGIRWIGPKIHDRFGAWVKSTRVSAILAVLSGGLSTVAVTLISGGHVTGKLIIAGFAAGVAAIGGYNAFWDVLFPADKKPAPVPLEGAEVKVRQPGSKGFVSLGLLMMLALLGFLLALSGCAWVKCELGKLPQTLQTVIPAVVSAVSDRDNGEWKGDLTEMSKALAPGQFDCLIKALAAAEAGSGPKATRPSIARGRYLEWLAEHPTSACRDVEIENVLSSKAPYWPPTAPKFIDRRHVLTFNQSARTILTISTPSTARNLKLTRFCPLAVGDTCLPWVDEYGITHAGWL